MKDGFKVRKHEAENFQLLHAIFNIFHKKETPEGNLFM